MGPKAKVHQPGIVDEPCHCTLLRKAARRVSAFYDHALDPTGLRITQYALLAQLDRSGPLTITDLAKIMVMDRNGLGHNLRLLEREDLLTAVAGKDRRSRQIALSAAGRRRLKDAKPYWQAAQHQLIKSGIFDGLQEPLSNLAGSDLTLP